MPLHDTDQEIPKEKPALRAKRAATSVASRIIAIPLTLWRWLIATLKWIIMLPVNIFYFCVGLAGELWPTVRLLLILFGIVFLLGVWSGQISL